MLYARDTERLIRALAQEGLIEIDAAGFVLGRDGRQYDSVHRLADRLTDLADAISVKAR